MMDDIDRIIRLPMVVERTGLSAATIYRKVRNGTFPRKVRISTRCTGWRISELERWMEDPMAYRQMPG